MPVTTRRSRQWSRVLPKDWARVDVLVANAGGGRGRPIDNKASTLDPVLLQLVVNMDVFGTVYIRATRSPRS